MSLGTSAADRGAVGLLARAATSPLAASIYAPILALSLWTYWFVMKALHRPAQTGRKQLLRPTGEVIQATARTLLVNVRGETWQAVSE